MINDSEKLKAFREQQSLTQTALAKKLGIKQQLIAMIENGTRPASAGFKLAFMKVYGIDWDNQIASGDTFNYEHLNINDNIVPITFYHVAAAAGKGITLTEQYPETTNMYFDKRFLKQILKTDNYNSLHLIYAKGDSMDSGWNQPDDIKDGDLLMIDTSQTTGNNKVFVILVNNTELRVKRLYKTGDTLFISSNNKNYKEEVYTPDKTDIEIKVIGKVVWNGNKDNN